MSSLCRTFLPSSLKSHQRSCTEDNPMVKPSREQSYTARANAKVRKSQCGQREREREESDNMISF